MNSKTHLEYILRLGDNALILGQRLSEWCGHGPVLEQDIALTNVALDLIGQAGLILKYAAKVENKSRNEDQLAFTRNVDEYLNVLLVEQPNEDFAYTIVRQFLYDAANYFIYRELVRSKDENLAAIAAKSLKEITYHLRFSSEWVIRLGDGTELSHNKMQTALDDLWMYSGEMLLMDETDKKMLEAGIGADLNKIKPEFEARVSEILKTATLEKPKDVWMQQGGKQGRHTEHLGHILSEMQYMQRTYPGLEW